MTRGPDRPHPNPPGPRLPRGPPPPPQRRQGAAGGEAFLEQAGCQFIPAVAVMQARQRVGPHPFGIPRGGAERALLASA